jgi:hypothetical protein
MRAFLALAMLFASPVAAQTALDLGDRRVDAIEDPLRIELRPNVASPGLERIRTAVEEGARAARDWQVKALGEERWELIREVRDQHRVTVAVWCDESGCDIAYVDSVNMLYSERTQSGAPIRAIHRNYNVWVRQLAGAISQAMGAPTTTTVGHARLNDLEAIPHVGDGGKKAYQEFLKRPKPRAFAIASNGAWGFSAPLRNPTYTQQTRLDVVGEALERCRRRGGDCRLYAVDDRVVWSSGR